MLVGCQPASPTGHISPPVAGPGLASPCQTQVASDHDWSPQLSSTTDYSGTAAGRLEITTSGFSKPALATLCLAGEKGRVCERLKISREPLQLTDLYLGEWVVAVSDGEQVGVGAAVVDPSGTADITPRPSSTLEVLVRDFYTNDAVTNAPCRWVVNEPPVSAAGRSVLADATGRVRLVAPVGVVDVECRDRMAWRSPLSLVRVRVPSHPVPMSTVRARFDVAERDFGFGVVRSSPGFQVTSIASESVGADAGLQVGDQIWQVDGRVVSTLSIRAFDQVLSDRPTWKGVSLSVCRTGQALGVEIPDHVL
jgi:hypothetical protein